MATTVDLREAQTRLSELVSLAAKGTEVVLAVDGEPRARLVPIGETARVPGLHAGAITMSDDFDKPLPDAFWSGE